MKIRERYNSWIPRMLGAEAITLYPFVFYTHGKLNETKSGSQIRRHEWIHVDQIRAVGFLRFYISYFTYYLAGRIQGMDHAESYWLIPYEIEAREKQKEPRQTFS